MSVLGALRKIRPPCHQLAKGDVIQVKGASVPPDLEDKWFIVEDHDRDGTAILSHPYLDEACTVKYRPTRSRRHFHAIQK